MKEIDEMEVHEDRLFWESLEEARRNLENIACVFLVIFLIAIYLAPIRLRDIDLERRTAQLEKEDVQPQMCE